MNHSELMDKDWVQDDEIRIEFEHEDGQIRRVTGDNARDLMQWFEACEGIMHTRSYRQEFPEIEWEVEE